MRATPICDRAETTPPLALPWRIAENVPSGTATMSATTMARATSSRVTWAARSASERSPPGSRTRCRSRPRTPPIHCRYCSHRGAVVPYCARQASSCSAVASVPRATVAGSPGMTRSSTKTSSEDTQTVARKVPASLRRRRGTVAPLSGSIGWVGSVPGELRHVERLGHRVGRDAVSAASATTMFGKRNRGRDATSSAVVLATFFMPSIHSPSFPRRPRRRWGRSSSCRSRCSSRGR